MNGDSDIPSLTTTAAAHGRRGLEGPGAMDVYRDGQPVRGCPRPDHPTPGIHRVGPPALTSSIPCTVAIASRHSVQVTVWDHQLDAPWFSSASPPRMMVIASIQTHHNSVQVRPSPLARLANWPTPGPGDGIAIEIDNRAGSGTATPCK